MSARDVIAEAIGEIQIHPTTQPQKLRCEPIVSDIILAALDAAGYAVVRKDDLAFARAMLEQYAHMLRQREAEGPAMAAVSAEKLSERLAAKEKP